MAYDRFLIAPYSEGLVTALEPWLISDEAYATLNNAYVWRGRVRKRFGGKLMGVGSASSLDAPLFSRLRINLGKTGAGGVLAGNVPGVIWKLGQQFSVGTIIFTVNVAVAGVQPMLSTDPLSNGTFNITTGAYVLNTTLPLADAYFYPAEPVMGLCNYAKGAISNHPLFGFDTQFVYLFTAYWDRAGVAQNVIFHGTNSDFFWTCNWNGITDNQTALFITNFNVADPIWYYNQDLLIPWATFSPAVTAAPNPVTTIQTARIIEIFKDRLVLLNTVEKTGANNVSYTNRCRYSHNASPFDANAFIQVNNTGFQGAGWLDAPTEEAIVSSEFIKDRLIVYFERSTYELAYTGNQVLPFVWQKLNTELGAESTFSTVPFDKAVLGIGNTGVHACNGSNVERIDIQIPDSIFEIVNKNEGVSRVVGIRDYYTEMVYWTFPDVTNTATTVYPNQVLVYNYKSNCWAFNDDCITFFGYYEQQQDIVWSQLTMQWDEYDAEWNAGILQSQFRQVIAGNQQGYTFIVDSNLSRNAPVMSLTDINIIGPTMFLTIINHTLRAGDFIFFHDCTGTLGLDGNIFEVQGVLDNNNIYIALPDPFAGVYLGGGNITRVSRIKMVTKQYNPYIDKGRDVYISKIDFNVLSTDYGQITIDYSPSTSDVSMITAGTATGSILGTSILETFPYPTIPFEAEQTKLWHPVYFQTGGEFVQFTIYLSNTQMATPNIAFAKFQLEGMILHTIPTSSRLE